jgi:hypothetical protein
MVRKDQTRNLEIPGSMLVHRPGMTATKEKARGWPRAFHPIEWAFVTR